MTHRIWAVTHTGLVRELNEDAYGATGLDTPSSDGIIVSAESRGLTLLAAVADGLGGHPAGEVASRLAIGEILGDRVVSVESLVDAVVGANEAVFDAMSADDGTQGMGTTIAVVLVHPGGLAVVNVGDSAVFQLRGDRLEQLSTDDVPPGGTGLPGLPSAVVTQTLGGAREFEPIQPRLYEDDDGQGGRILLCTDGLTNYVPKDLIARALGIADGRAAIESLLALALAAGAPDNVTLLAIDTESLADVDLGVVR